MAKLEEYNQLDVFRVIEINKINERLAKLWTADKLDFREIKRLEKLIEKESRNREDIRWKEFRS